MLQSISSSERSDALHRTDVLQTGSSYSDHLAVTPNFLAVTPNFLAVTPNFLAVTPNFLAVTPTASQ
jgi:hypothetical protein